LEKSTSYEAPHYAVFFDYKMSNKLIIIVIIICKRALFEPQPYLEDSARLHPVVSSLNFATIFFFTERGRQPCVQPPNLEGQIPVFKSPKNRVAQL
jgi:hypothetical protein